VPKRPKPGEEHVVTGISMPIDLLALIDADRGDVSRSRYIERLIEQNIDKFKVIKGVITEVDERDA